MRIGNIFRGVSSEDSDLSYKIDVLNKTVDIGFYRYHQLTLVEVDGPTHFLIRTKTQDMIYDGSTLLQSALIQRTCPDSTLLRFRYKECEQILQSGNPRKTGLMLADYALACGHGAYETCKMQDGSVGLREHLLQDDDTSDIMCPKRIMWPYAAMSIR